MKLAITTLGTALALASGAPAIAQEKPQQAAQPGEQQRTQQVPSIAGWNVTNLYPNGWTAKEMLDIEVRGDGGEVIGEVADIIVDRHGNISRIVVEVGGFMELGDQHIGIPWEHVKIGQDMAFVQVPLKEVENGTYSLFGRIPQGEDVSTARTSWRVHELIGDYANLEDVPRYGLVTDVVFNNRGQVQAVVVDPAGPVYGRYAYPYTGYYPAAFGYALPYREETIVQLQPFDYARLGERSPYSGGATGGAATGQTRQQRK